MARSYSSKWLSLLCILTSCFILKTCDEVTYSNVSQLPFCPGLKPYAWTRELVFTTLSCCVQGGYDTLTWYRNNTRWNMNSSYEQYRYYLDGDNLIMMNPRLGDRGNYTCVVTRQDNSWRHSYQFYVFAQRTRYAEPFFSEKPKPNDAIVKIGNNMSVSCGGDFSSSEYPFDPANTVIWYRVEQNGTRVHADYLSRHVAMDTCASHGLFIYSQLTIMNISREDFNSLYECVITNRHSSITFNITVLESKPDVPGQTLLRFYTPLVSVITAILVISIASFLIIYHFRVEIKLLWWDRFGKDELTDSINAGAFLVYSSTSDTDYDFVVHTLLDRLESELGYPLIVSDRDFEVGAAQPAEYTRCMKMSARFVAILSPEFFSDRYCVFALCVALKENYKVVFVKHREIENLDEIDVPELVRRAMPVIKTVSWPGVDSGRKTERFFKELRLKLPPNLSIYKSESFSPVI